MDRLLVMDQEQFIVRMQEEVRRALEQVAAAVNGAADGNVISGSEMRVRDVMVELQRKAFETAVQMRIDSTESSFSPSKGPARQEQAQQGQKRMLPIDANGSGEPVANAISRPGRRQRRSGG